MDKIKFSARTSVSSMPQKTFVVNIGHLNGQWATYAAIEFIRKEYPHVHQIYPSMEAVHDQKIDALVQAAIAFLDGDVTEIERWEQSSWGVHPDIIIYEIKE